MVEVGTKMTNIYHSSKPKTTVITADDMRQANWQDRLVTMKSFRFKNDLFPVSVRFNSVGNGYYYWRIIKNVKGFRYAQHVGSHQDMTPDFLMMCVKLLYDRIQADSVEDL